MVKFLLALGLLVVTTPALATVSSVAMRDGVIFCNGTAITSGGKDSQPTLSPDGSLVAFVRTIGPAPGEFDAPPSELWLADCKGGAEHRLLASKPDEEPKLNLASVSNPTFSLDGGFVYVMTQAWVTSDAIHQVNIKTGEEHYVTDSNGLKVIRNGPYRGYLLVTPHMYHGNGNGSYDPTYIYHPDGKWKMLVPGTANEGGDNLTDSWLAKHKWTAW